MSRIEVGMPPVEVELHIGHSLGLIQHALPHNLMVIN